MTFRRATIHDAATLWAWRMTDEVANDYPTHTSITAHERWLTHRLNNPLIQLLIWVENNWSLGMVRIDSNGELTYHAHNPDVATRMLTAAHAYAPIYGGRLKITLDQDDPKRGPLEQAGFVVYPAVFLAYKPEKDNA